MLIIPYVREQSGDWLSLGPATVCMWWRLGARGGGQGRGGHVGFLNLCYLSDQTFCQGEQLASPADPGHQVPSTHWVIG
jgi:hypothetical protein